MLFGLQEARHFTTHWRFLFCLLSSLISWESSILFSLAVSRRYYRNKFMSKQETQGARNWYAIHTYAGYENVVLRNLKQRIDSLGMNDKIFNVIVPVEKKIKIKGGKRVEVEEKIYPGYVLVDMIVTDDSWYVVRNTPRVTGFVGAGVNPVPLKKEEVDFLFKKMDAGTLKHNIDMEVGETVLINDGPFKDLEGKVNSVDQERGKIKVFVSMFGRETPVELDFLQVKKI